MNNFYYPDPPATVRICFNEKQRVLHNVVEWGNRTGWMYFCLQDGSEMLVNPDKVLWLTVNEKVEDRSRPVVV